MCWQRLEDQGTKTGSVEPSECIERVMEVQEFVQAMTYHLQCMDTLNFNVKQGIFNQMQGAIREIAHWHPQIQNARRQSSQMETYRRNELYHTDSELRIDAVQQLEQVRQAQVEQVVELKPSQHQCHGGVKVFSLNRQPIKCSTSICLQWIHQCNQVCKSDVYTAYATKFFSGAARASGPADAHNESKWSNASDELSRSHTNNATAITDQGYGPPMHGNRHHLQENCSLTATNSSLQH